MNTFMVNLTMRNSEFSGYTWLNGKPSNLDCYVEVEAKTLKDAVDLVELKYTKESNFFVDTNKSYMKLPKIER